MNAAQFQSHGLNQYDYQARFLDNAYGRFTTVDPLAEKYYGWSPYAYCMNNPVNAIDPDGKKVIMWMPNTPINASFYRYAKSIENNDHNRYDIFAHSNHNVIVKGIMRLDTPQKFIEEMKKDPDFAKAFKSGQKITIKLHSCYAGTSKDGSGREVDNIARQISDEFPNLKIVAADGEYHVPNGKEEVKEDKYRTGTFKYFENGKEVGSSKDDNSYSDDQYKQENAKPKEYQNWGLVRRWFYDSFGF